MVDPVSAAAVGAVSKAVQSAADEGGKGAGGLVSRVFGPAADELGQALARFTAFRVGNVQRIAEAADRKSAATGRDGMINPRIVRSLLDEGSYCDDELMAEYLGGAMAGARSKDGRDDRAVSWTEMITSMSSLQLRTHLVLYREWAHAFRGCGVDNLNIDQEQANMFVDAVALLGDFHAHQPDLHPNEIASHTIPGLARLDLIGSGWWVGQVAEMPGEQPEGLTFDTVYRVTPSHVGVELYGWACGLPGLTFAQLAQANEVIEPNADIPRPAVVLPRLHPPKPSDGQGA